MTCLLAAASFEEREKRSHGACLSSSKTYITISTVPQWLEHRILGRRPEPSEKVALDSPRYRRGKPLYYAVPTAALRALGTRETYHVEVHVTPGLTSTDGLSSVLRDGKLGVLSLHGESGPRAVA
jgi:hypothetical protein